MALYVPFIHKISKKKKEVAVQIPLYIEEYPMSPLSEKSKKEDEESIVIIQLL